MAEVGLIGTIIGIAGAGVKLSITLYSFSETVTAAPAEIKNIARDVSLTAAVLEELGANLKEDDQGRLCSGAAVQTAQEVVAECEGVFREIDAMLARAMESSSAARRGPVKKKMMMGSGGKLALSALERLRWPFLQPKMGVLRGNLDRLKSTLVLMLNVLTYARDLRAEKKAQSKDNDDNSNNDGYQRTLLENLLRANEEATKNYQHLLKTIGTQDEAVVQRQAPIEHRDQGSAQPSTDREMPSSAAGPFLSLARHAPSDGNVAGSSSEASPPPQPEYLEFTMRKCLKRIESELLRFEQPGYVASHVSRLHVNIELEKWFPQETPRRPTPWLVLSIVDDGHGGAEHGDNRSNLGSDDLDMYASVAAGAIESIGNEEDSLTPEERIPRRFRKLKGIYRDTSPSQVNRISQSAGTRPVLESETETLGHPARVQRRSSSRTWYSSVWGSLPSPAAAMDSIQETVKNSGLFFGVEEESENPDTVLEYNKPGAGEAGASQPSESSSPRFARSQTFDDILKPPSTKDRTTRPSPVMSPAVGSNINLESSDDWDRRPALRQAVAEGEAVKQDLLDVPATVARTEESSEETANSSVEDTVGDAKPAEEEAPDAIDRLLKQWTTLYDNQ